VKRGDLRKLWRSGEPFIWLTGGALALALIMVAGLIGVILLNALGFFWPADVVRLTLRDGKTFTGSVVER
jgi:phosphate transport system permease protein